MKYSKLLVVIGVILLVGSLVSSGFVCADMLKEQAPDETTQGKEKVDETFSKPTKPPKPTEGMASLDTQLSDLGEIAGDIPKDDVRLTRTVALLIDLATEGELAAQLAAVRKQAKVLEEEGKEGTVENVEKGIKKVLTIASLEGPLGIVIESQKIAGLTEMDIIPLAASVVEKMEKSKREELVQILKGEKGNKAVLIVASNQGEIDTINQNFTTDGQPLVSFEGKTLFFGITDDTVLISHLIDIFDKQQGMILNCTLQNTPAETKQRLSRV